MKRFVLFISLVVIFIQMVTVQSFASTIDFSGTITRIYSLAADTGQITYHDSSSVLNHIFSLGDVYTGNAEFSQTGSLLGGNNNYAVYNHTTVKGMQININDYIFDSYSDNRPNGYVQIQNNIIMGNKPVDGFSIFDKYYKDFWTQAAEFYLFDNSADVYNDLSIPDMINMSDFDTRMFHHSFVDNNGNQLHLFGRTNSINNLSSTPEPTTLLLLGVGLLGVTNIMRRSIK